MNENKDSQFLERIRSEIEELQQDLQGLPINDFKTVGDFGCGWGFITYALAQILPASNCIGIDKFDPDDPPTLNTGFSVENVRDWYMKTNIEHHLDFRQANIVSGEHIPFDLDLVYCKRVLYNVFLKGNEKELSQAINHIANSLRPSGWFCLVEIYEPQFQAILEEILNQANFAFTPAQCLSRPYNTLLKNYDLYPYLIYRCQKKEVS